MQTGAPQHREYATRSQEAALDCDLEPQVLVTSGYPADQGKPFRRRPLAERVRYAGGET
jgi:hypothetical protein